MGGGNSYQYDDDIKFYLPSCLNDIVQGVIAKSGDFFEIFNIKQANKFLKDGANILDIGANIGNHSVYYAMVRKARKIHAFEPTRDVFEVLCKNIELNSLQSIIKPHNIALGECDGKASIKERPAGNLGGTSLKADTSGEIIVKSLDDIQAEFDEKIDFVKIDVEGFESQVLLGAKAFLAYHKPTIMIEIHRPKFKEVSEILDSLNYKLAEKLVSSVDFIYLPK